MGANSLGWCAYRLNENNEPISILRMGVRVFSDGREPKGHTSLAAHRRAARQARRRRDRVLKRRTRMIEGLIQFGLLPDDLSARKLLQTQDPYELRAKGLNQPLHPHELGRALYHLCRKRGFKSSRKDRSTEEQEKETGKVKSAIQALKMRIADAGCRTVGEYLAREHLERRPIRGRRRNDGSYVLYMQRDMVAAEFDLLWDAQALHHPELLTADAFAYLKDTLLFQRPLLPVKAGRCQFEENEFRARLSHPLQQEFRLLQELNNLRLISGTESKPLTLEQRNILLDHLRTKPKATLASLRALLGFKRNDSTRFNLETENRKDIKGDQSAAQFSQPACLGDGWFSLPLEQQAELAEWVATEANEDDLVAKLVAAPWSLPANTAQAIARCTLPDDFGSLSAKALAKIVPKLRETVITYDVAVEQAGYGSHSDSHTGEIFDQLPYYGQILRAYTAPAERSTVEAEKQFGKISNPTVHIGLNQLRLLVNALSKRFGPPSQVVVELTREFGLGPDKRRELIKRQVENTERNVANDEQLLRLGQRANRANRQKLQLWQELGLDNALDRQCVYSGKGLSWAMLFSDEIEVDHILPFSQSLHDGLGNKVLCTRQANRDKGNRTPYEAFGSSPPGYDWESIVSRAYKFKGRKPELFSATAMEDFLDGRDFLDRHLTDTAYLSKFARIYLSYICHRDQVWVSTGKLTSLIRGKFALSELLSPDGKKNRDDHRHHALDSAVIGLVDRSLLQSVARAAARAERAGENRLLADLDLPWPAYRDDLRDTLDRVITSHRPDRGKEAGLHNDTNYGWRADSDKSGNPLVGHRVALEGLNRNSAEKVADKALSIKLLSLIESAGAAKEVKKALEQFSQDTGIRRVMIEERLDVIPISDRRTGVPYRYVKGDGNYCYEIYQKPDGKWSGKIISNFEANQNGYDLTATVVDGLPVIMRIRRDDILLVGNGTTQQLQRVAKLSEGVIALVAVNEANVDARTRDKLSGLKYTFKSPNSLRADGARVAGIDILGYVNIKSV